MLLSLLHLLVSGEACSLTCLADAYVRQFKQERNLLPAVLWLRRLTLTASTGSAAQVAACGSLYPSNARVRAYEQRLGMILSVPSVLI